MPSCLYIIDVQKGFINADTAHIPAMVEVLQAQYDHILVSKFTNPPDSSHRRFLKWQRFAPESQECDLAFIPNPNAMVFEKSMYNGVSEHLLAYLQTNEIKDVALCGIDTDCCVLINAVALFEKGIRPIILSDACASHGGAAAHAAGLKILERLVGCAQIQ